MDEIEEFDSGHIAPLGADTINDVNQAHHCFSCSAPILGVYCKDCGQKNDDFRRSIFSLIKETLGTLFGFESRIWKTWATLLIKPGKVPREFCDGVRAKWSSPVRVYIAMSILLFGYLSLFDTQIFSFEMDASLKDTADPSSEIRPSDIDIKFHIDMFARQSEIDARNTKTNFELLNIWVQDGINITSQKNAPDEGIEVEGIEVEGIEDVNSDDERVDSKSGDIQTPLLEPQSLDTVTPKLDAQFPLTDGSVQSPSTTTVDYVNINGMSRTVSYNHISKFIMSVIRNPELINHNLFKYLPRVMFFVMPFSMLIGAIFIRGKNALLYDHLVHSAYIHAVMFLVILIAVLIGRFIETPYVNITFLIAMILYLPISVKRMFARGWFKSILTSYSVAFVYVLIISFVILGFIVSDVSTLLDLPAA